MMAMTGVGGMIGALVLATANPTSGRGLLLVGAMAIFGVGLIIFSLATYLTILAVVFVVAAILGFGQSPIFSLLNAVLLNAAPIHMRGRVIGLLSLDRAMISFGSVLAGFLASTPTRSPEKCIYALCWTLCRSFGYILGELSCSNQRTCRSYYHYVLCISLLPVC